MCDAWTVCSRMSKTEDEGGEEEAMVVSLYLCIRVYIQDMSSSYKKAQGRWDFDDGCAIWNQGRLYRVGITRIGEEMPRYLHIYM